jgi:2-haloalkanoic acid dehalogenase type II
LSRPDIITFDCYGTLIDWNGGISAALRAEAARQGRDADSAAILAAYHAAEPRVQAGQYRPYREILTLLEAEVAAELGWDPPASPGYLADSLPSWPPFADTNPSLRRLADAGFGLGILSNIDDDLLAGTRTHLEADFDLLVTAEQVRGYKPGSQHFQRALAAVGGERERLVHVAQSHYHDVEPARALDIRTVWVNRLAESVPPDGARPDADLPGLAAAVDWILAR